MSIYCIIAYRTATIKAMISKTISERTKHPTHPVTPSQQKTIKDASPCNPQPERPRMTIRIIAITMVRSIVRNVAICCYVMYYGREKLILLSNIVLRVCKCLGRVREANSSQLNASVPISSTESGMTTLRKTQSAKALLSIFFR